MKYINLETFEITTEEPKIFEVDDEIAEAILLLNKKGYKTLFSCAGHTDEMPTEEEKAIICAYRNNEADYQPVISHDELKRELGL